MMEQIPHEDSEEFLMYYYKIYPCSKRYSHPWLECGFSHPNERATRRDPRIYQYSGIACSEMKKMGVCSRGDACPYAHSVFEYWLHPTRYRTQLCAEGPTCTRKFCFFAHNELELRHVPTCKPVAASPDRQSAQALAAAALPLVRSSGSGGMCSADANGALPSASAGAFMGSSASSFDFTLGLPGGNSWGGGRGPPAGRSGAQRRSSFIVQPRSQGPARDHTKPLRRASDTAMLAPAMAQHLLQHLPVETLGLLTAADLSGLQGYPSSAVQQAALQKLLAAGLGGMPAAAAAAAPGIGNLNTALALQLQLLQQQAASSSAPSMAPLQLPGLLGASSMQQQHQQQQHQQQQGMASGGVDELAGLLQQMQVARQGMPGQGAAAAPAGMDPQLQSLLQILAQQPQQAQQQSQQQQQQQQQPDSFAMPGTQAAPQIMGGLMPATSAPPGVGLPGQQPLPGLQALQQGSMEQQQQQQQQLAALLDAAGLKGLGVTGQQSSFNMLFMQHSQQSQHSQEGTPGSPGLLASARAKPPSLSRGSADPPMPSMPEAAPLLDSATSSPTSISNASNIVSGTSSLMLGAQQLHQDLPADGYLSGSPSQGSGSYNLLQLFSNRA